MIKKAYFVSIWDEGFEHEHECKVDTETKEILDFGCDFYPDIEAYGYEKFIEEYVVVEDVDYVIEIGDNGKRFYR